MGAGDKRGGVKSFIRKGSWRNRGILREGGGGGWNEKGLKVGSQEKRGGIR